MADATARRSLHFDRGMRTVPFAALAASLLLVRLVPATELTHESYYLIVPLTVLAAAWLLWWVTLHPQWEHRRDLMAVFFAGFLVLIFLLVWCSPLFGFFAWTGYLFTDYALDGRRRMFGGAGVAVATAVSQVNGFHTLDEPGAWAYFAILLVFNVGISGALIAMTARTNQHSVQREERIDELAEANAKLAAALQENAGLHAQLMAQAREAGVLDERQRMAGEIHDVLAQGLTGIVTQLEAADAAAARPDDWRRHLDNARKLARESLTEARRSVQALRPRTLDTAALPDAIGEVAATWSTLTGVSAQLITTGNPRPLLPEIETTLLRTAQEALANVARHAAAHRVGLTLSYMEDVVTLDVRDDGAGFDPVAPRDPAYEGGFGLNAMRERVGRIAGTLEVESEPGGGTAVSACVPAITLGAAA
ncbi:sensor histidine kinase [Micromonosporaceae bacterium Da 78-11]